MRGISHWRIYSSKLRRPLISCKNTILMRIMFLVYDNATTHLRCPDGALSAWKMPKFTSKPESNWLVEVNAVDATGKPIYAPPQAMRRKVYLKAWRLSWRNVVWLQNHNWRPSAILSWLSRLVLCPYNPWWILTIGWPQSLQAKYWPYLSIANWCTQAPIPIPMFLG